MQQTVLEAPSIIHPLEAYIVPKGESVKLEVEFTGYPKPEIYWYRNGKEILPSPNIQIEERKSSLTIHKATKEVAGKYEVRAMNSAGEARSSGSVTVTGMFHEHIVCICSNMTLFMVPLF